MTVSFAGGCACGKLRFEARSQPVFQNHCHCRECRKRSGTGHSSYLTFAGRAEIAIDGEAKGWRVAGESGNGKVHAFCPDCGAPVFLTFEAMPDLIAIHAGALDRPELFQPQAVTYGVGAPPWDVMDAALPVFERMPPA